MRERKLAVAAILLGAAFAAPTAWASPNGDDFGRTFLIVPVQVEESRSNASTGQAWLGVQIQNLTPELAISMGVPTVKGALVGQVVENSPAEHAGFAQGDIITAVNGTAVEEARVLTQEVAALKAGEEARFTVMRDGATRIITATMGDASRVASNGANIDADRPWLGVQVQDLTPELATSMGVAVANGALVAEVVENSPAQRAGFAQGDIITAVNGTTVEEARVLTQQVAALKAGEEARFTVMRDGATRTLTATVEKRAPNGAALSQQPADRPATDFALAGVTLSVIDPALRTQHGLAANVTGVVVTSVDANGDAAMKGLKPGDVIKRVGSLPVLTLADVKRGLEEAKHVGRDTVAALVASPQGDRFVALRIVQG